MKKVYCNIYLVKDTHGNECSATCEEGSDIIQVCGIHDSDNKRQYFESDAYHLEYWCKEHGFEYKKIEKVFDFDTLWEE